MNHKVAQLAALFVWYLAKFLVREAAWMTAEAARNSIRRRRRLEGSDHRVIDLRREGETWIADRFSYDGPAGYREDPSLEDPDG